MSDRIYVRTDGRMDGLEGQPFDSEDAIQELIAEQPDLVSGGQMRPDDPLRWILVTREQPIPETLGASRRWAVDHLLIDQDAVPTLVEVKKKENPELRRKVVGQLLEYAAYARHSWDVDDLRRTFEAQENWEESFRALLGGKDEPTADEFWKRVQTNLRASNLRLLFVADDIPDPLVEVIEFLNEQMRDVEVLAVEVKRYNGGGHETFVPRVIGRLAKPRGLASSLTLDGILDQFPEGAIRNAAQTLIDRARAAGATFEPGSRGTSIRGHCPLWDQPITVAWLYPSEVGWMRTRHFSFGAAIFDYDPPPPPTLHDVLLQYTNQFETDSYARDASSKGVKARYVQPGDAAKHIETLAERVETVLRRLAELKMR